MLKEQCDSVATGWPKATGEDEATGYELLAEVDGRGDELPEVKVRGCMAVYQLEHQRHLNKHVIRQKKKVVKAAFPMQSWPLKFADVYNATRQRLVYQFLYRDDVRLSSSVLTDNNRAGMFGIGVS
jgi:hypothetical protein